MAEPKVTPPGSVSVSVTPVAVDGPPFPTTIVYVRGSPTSTGSGESLLLTERFVAGLTTVVSVSVLLAVFVSI